MKVKRLILGPLKTKKILSSDLTAMFLKKACDNYNEDTQNVAKKLFKNTLLKRV